MELALPTEVIEQLYRLGKSIPEGTSLNIYIEDGDFVDEDGIDSETINLVLYKPVISGVIQAEVTPSN